MQPKLDKFPYEKNAFTTVFEKPCKFLGVSNKEDVVIWI
jgi:hypothetical protein